MVKQLFALGLVLGVALLAAGCGDDAADEGTTIGVTDTGPLDVGEADTAEPDAGEVAGACRGLKPNNRASLYDDECAAATECQVMPQKQGGCYCQICGPKGAKIACLQVECARPRGDGGDGT